MQIHVASIVGVSHPNIFCAAPTREELVRKIIEFCDENNDIDFDTYWNVRAAGDREKAIDCFFHHYTGETLTDGTCQL